jgi:hypothetical protein
MTPDEIAEEFTRVARLLEHVEHCSLNCTAAGLNFAPYRDPHLARSTAIFKLQRRLDELAALKGGQEVPMYDPDLDAHVCQYCDYAIRDQAVTFPRIDAPLIEPVFGPDDLAWHVQCALVVNELERQRHEATEQ